MAAYRLKNHRCAGGAANVWALFSGGAGNSLKYCIYILAVCIFAVCAPNKIEAQGLPEIAAAPSQKKTIAFLPHALPIYHYKDVELKGEYDVLAIKRALMRNAQSNPYLKVLSSKEIEEAFLNSDPEALEAGAQAEADMSFVHNFMATLNYSSAIVMLRRIIDNYDKSLYAYYKPHNVAQAYQQLAYAYIFRREESAESDPQAAADLLHSARLAFLELIRSAPYLTMLEGRQPALRVMLYDQALKLFLENAVYRQTPVGAATALSHRLNADYLVFVRIAQMRDGTLKLELDMYSAQTQTFEYASIDLTPESAPEAQTRRFIDEATYVLDAFYACANITPEKKSRKKFAFHGGFLISSHILHPTRELTLGYGASIDFAYRFHRLFYAKFGFHFVSLIHDKARTLNDNFEIYRLPIVAGFNYEYKHIKPYIGIGIDLSFSSHYTIAQSAACKVFGVNDRECNPGDIAKYDDVFALNLTAQGGISFLFDPLPMAITLELFIDVTAYPTEKSIFRYPFGGSLMFGYLF